MAEQLALMAVHAHPDDEAIGTGGVLARYSAEGARTVLVTCTNGEQGDDVGALKPGQPGHRPEEVAAVRLAELRQAVEILGVTDLEHLGYRDSGMAGWEANADPGVFCNIDAGEPVARLGELMKLYRPQVVITYGPDGGYGHPDHIQAHRITLAALEATGLPAKLYYSVVPRSGVQWLRQVLKEAEIPTENFDVPDDFGTPDGDITTVVDVSQYMDRKLDALNAHASQTENFFLTQLPPEVLTEIMSKETFVLQAPRAGPELEDDLFAGLR